VQVLYYNHKLPGATGLVNHRSYLGSVQAVHLNASHAAVLIDGRLLVHAIHQQLPSDQAQHGQHAGEASFDSEPDLYLPKDSLQHSDPVACAALSEHFVITAGASGSLRYHLLQDGQLAQVNEHRHLGGCE